MAPSKRNRSKPLAQARRKKPASDEPTDDASISSDSNTSDGPSVPFEIVYLSAPNRKRKRGGTRHLKAGTQEANSFDPRLSQQYLVRLKEDFKGTDIPEWRDLDSFQALQHGDFKFAVGDVVFVLAGSETLLERETDTDEGAAFDNCWVAQIIEIRAVDQNDIFARIWWLHRPEELPSGRLRHHADGEVFPSNHMDLIEATSIQGKCQSVKRLDEDRFDQVSGGYVGLFWRQVLVVGGDTYNGTVMNSLITICTCNSPINPDWGPLACNGQEGCGRWLHAACIKDDVLKRVHQKIVSQTEHSGPVSGQPPRTTFFGNVVDLVKRGTSSSSAGNVPQHESLQEMSLEEMAKDFEVVLGFPVASTHEPFAPLMATVIKANRPDKDSTQDRKTNEYDRKASEEIVVCLFCRVPLMLQKGHAMLDPELLEEEDEVGPAASDPNLNDEDKLNPTVLDPELHEEEFGMDPAMLDSELSQEGIEIEK